MSAAFEWRVKPDFYRPSDVHNTVLVMDNYPPGNDGCGQELFLEVAEGHVGRLGGVAPNILALSADPDVSATLSRAEVEALHEFLGDWLAS